MTTINELKEKFGWTDEQAGVKPGKVDEVEVYVKEPKKK
jgi:hypothetical protein